jgi:hypothetical protein
VKINVNIEAKNLLLGIVRPDLMSTENWSPVRCYESLYWYIVTDVSEERAANTFWKTWISINVSVEATNVDCITHWVSKAKCDGVKLRAADLLDRSFAPRSELMWQHHRICLFICCLFNDDVNSWDSCPEGRRRVSGTKRQKLKTEYKIILRTSPSILSAVMLCAGMEFKLAFRVAYMG